MAPLEHFEAYATRIGLDGAPTLATLHRAHATSVPFENFDSSAGRAVLLDRGHLEDKIVARRRGGYCFEQNLLFMAALESIGVADVTPVLARVRRGDPDAPRPLNHLLLRVVEDGEPWLADVGFGGGGLLDPIRFEIGAQSEQDGWRYRVVADGAEMVLQVLQDDAWTDMYGFVPEPVQAIDIEVSNWFTSTHPDSPFVTGVVAGARRVERTLALFSFDECVLVERQVGQPQVITVPAIAEVPTLLAERFGIAGVTLREGRLVRGERV